MSAWRLLVKALHDTGKPAAWQREFDHLVEPQGWRSGIKKAALLGLVVRAESGRYVLTGKGRDWCEGRLIDAREGGGPGANRIVFKATWIKAAP